MWPRVERSKVTTGRSLLVVEDEPSVRRMLAAMLGETGLDAGFASDAEEALEMLAQRPCDVVLSDVVMPGRSGLELVKELRSLYPQTPVLLMTGFGSIDSAVEAMQAGAFDYLTKPLRKVPLLEVLERAFEQRERAARRPRSEDAAPGKPELIGPSPALREIASFVDKIADAASNVLITGESGTGKELVARIIHARSARFDAPFVPINCTAIPEGLLESELFGHVRGAFTGAVASRRGLFEEANGGTLFLDEIGDMGLGLQSKLLRVLQEREVRPVGGSRSTRVDVRIVAATHRDLRAEIEMGSFRVDLFYRLNVIPIHIPPLRERPEDVCALAEHFARARSGGRATLEAAALDRLATMPGEGNVRELENTIERALAVGNGEHIRAEDLLPDDPGADVSPAPEEAIQALVDRRVPLRAIEERMIEETLKATGGNKVEAARILGISRRTLYRRGATNVDDD
jgi:DNA-binding NtrC family response regulator